MAFQSDHTPPDSHIEDDHSQGWRKVAAATPQQKKSAVRETLYFQVNNKSVTRLPRVFATQGVASPRFRHPQIATPQISDNAVASS